MTVINTNVNAVLAQNSLVKNERAMSSAMEQLSTGKRINSAADDAAGMAIASKMTAQIRGLDQAGRNINDAVAMIQTAEGATGEITNMLQRMRELAVQASSGTYTTKDKANIELEFQALLVGIDNIADTTQWNGRNVLDGSGSATVFQIGANDGQLLTVDLGNLNTDAYVAGSAGSSVIATSAKGVAAMTSVEVGSVTVAVSGLTSTAGLVTALNADSTFSASYLATESTANTGVTITEKSGAYTATGPTVTLNGAATAVAGSSLLTISDDEANSLTSVAAGGVNVNSAALAAATNVAGVAAALNADTNFAAAYTATAGTGTLTITELVGTDAGPTVTTTSTAAYTSTGTPGAGDGAAVLQSNTMTISDAEAQTLLTLDFTANSGGASGAVDVSGAANVAAVATLLNADTNFTAAFTATTGTGTLVITEKAGTTANSGTGIVAVVTSTTAYNDSTSVITAGTAPTSATTATGVVSVLGLGSDISGLTSTTASVLATLDTALEAISTQNATNGAAINQLEYTADSLANVSLNTQASRSRIEDADYAKATTELARTQIIQQAGTAMLAQANQQSQGVLALLQ